MNFSEEAPTVTAQAVLCVSVGRLLKPQQQGIFNMYHWGTEQGPENWHLLVHV